MGSELKFTGFKRFIDAAAGCMMLGFGLAPFLFLYCRSRSGFLFPCIIHIALTLIAPRPLKMHNAANEAAATTTHSQRKYPEVLACKHSCWMLDAE